MLCSDEPARAEVHQALLQALLDRAARDKALSCSVYTPFMFDEFDLYDEIIKRLINYHEVKELGVDPEILERSGKKGSSLRVRYGARQRLFRNHWFVSLGQLY